MNQERFKKEKDSGNQATLNEKKKKKVLTEHY